MDRYRVAPARPVCLSSAGPGGHLRPRSSGAEIGIFTAERYFSAADVIKRHDAVLLRPDHHHHDPPPLPSRMSAAASDAASQSGRHTAASSEASWNSRSGLLSGGAHHSPAVTRMKATSRAGNGSKKSGSGWTLCPCLTGRKAVMVTSEPRSPATDARFSAQSAVDECIESAIFKPVIKSPPLPTMSDEEEVPAAKTKVTVTPGTRAFPLAANNVPAEAFAAAIGAPPAGEEGSPVPRGRQDHVVVVDEEAMSDASSDLFDLESFAASSSYPATSFRGGRRSRRNSDDDDHLPLPYAEPALSECMYAPSEASVVWSVATAEGGAFDAASAANFSSAASACGGVAMEDFRFVVPGDDEFAAAMSVSRSGAGRNKKGGGFLDSCRCEKAVSVGPTPVRMVRPPAYPSAAAAAKAKKGSAARRHPAGRVHVPVRT
ncbi:hypothetical protein PR202_ga23941 [Eleusine coracana subsp. coracana]|uniref:Uncharacterized protein n=1 Tax=Eleusine coracana subsp. coracana TaxID=191504 RepID=A0AAV5D6F9_ELECO|nr:hypothetical protein PR202_ga23941 [Eleusine coracana subsp. coracana]